jgi:hypothetical protein
MSKFKSLRDKAKKARATKATKKSNPSSKAGMQKKQGKGTPYSRPDFGGKKSSGSGSSSGSNNKSGTFKDFEIPAGSSPGGPGGFEEEVKQAQNTNDLINTVRKFDELKKVKDIYKNSDKMFDQISANQNLTQFQKNNIRAQIQYVKENHGRLGYSLNELLGAVGTNAFNQIVKRTPVDKSTADSLGITDQVQGVFDKYGRDAVIGPDGVVRAISPTNRQALGDAGRLFGGLLGLGPASQFLTGGKGFDIKPPQYGFGDVPTGGSAYLAGTQYANPINLANFDMTKPGMGIYQTPSSSGAAKALQFAPMRDARAGRTPETTTQQGDGNGEGDANTTSSTFAYVPFARPVSYNYMGGPEQMYLGGGFTQDGVPIGPFLAADGGIANFKGYGY